MPVYFHLKQISLHRDNKVVLYCIVISFFFKFVLFYFIIIIAIQLSVGGELTEVLFVDLKSVRQTYRSIICGLICRSEKFTEVPLLTSYLTLWSKLQMFHCCFVCPTAWQNHQFWFFIRVLFCPLIKQLKDWLLAGSHACSIHNHCKSIDLYGKIEKSSALGLSSSFGLVIMSHRLMMKHKRTQTSLGLVI